MTSRLPQRLGAAIFGLIAGLAAGFEISDGSYVALIGSLLLTAAFVALVRRTIPATERRRMIALVLCAFVMRVAVAVVLRAASLALGGDGTITGDDQGYYNVSWGLADFVRGGSDALCRPPTWCGASYLFGTFVYVEAFVFTIFGRDLLLVETINAAFGAALVVLVWDMARMIFGRRTAWFSAAAVTLYPGLILFSALNVKDPLAALLTAVVLWALVRFMERPRWSMLALSLVALAPIHGIRQYVFYGLAIVVPVASVSSPSVRGSRTVMTWLSAALLGSTALVAFNVIASGSTPLTDKPLEVFEYIRTGMTRGRTGFAATPTPEIGRGSGAAGGSLTNVSTVPTTVPTVVPTTVATVVPTTVATVRPTSRPTTVVASGVPVQTTSPTTEPTTAPTTAPTTTPTTAPTTAPAPSASEPGADPGSLVLTRTLSYLPRGIAYVLFAPFPWAVGRVIDAAVIPDTLFWYVLLFGALWGAWIERTRWRMYLPLFVFTCGMLGLFALVEGNVGTLYRHRAITVVPTIAIFAGPSLARIAALITKRLRRIP